MKKLPRFWRAAVSLALTLSLSLVFVKLPSLLACTDHVAESLTLALCVGMGCYLLIGGRNPWLLVSIVILAAFMLWVGSSPTTPFRPQLLLGFDVTTQTRSNVRILPGAVLTLAAGKPTGLQALTNLGNVRCNWMSTRGGNFDDPQSCATVYVPPQSESDIVKVSIQPGCGLPPVVGQIKVSILP